MGSDSDRNSATGIASRGGEKEANEEGGAPEQPLSAAPELAADEYPTGATLVILTGAVVLSVFLISLDQVSN